MQVYICKFVSKILDILNDGFCVDDAHVHAASEDEDFEIFIIKNANPFSDPNVEEPLPPVTDAVTDPHSNHENPNKITTVVEPVAAALSLGLTHFKGAGD